MHRPKVGKSPRHPNTTSFKNKHPRLKDLERKVLIRGTCQKCYDQLNWRLKYGKYKPRKSPGVCFSCKGKKVFEAYHIVCPACSAKLNVCCKCKTKIKEPIVPFPKRSLVHKKAYDEFVEGFIKTRLNAAQRKTLSRKIERYGEEFSLSEILKTMGIKLPRDPTKKVIPDSDDDESDSDQSDDNVTSSQVESKPQSKTITRTEPTDASPTD